MTALWSAGGKVDVSGRIAEAVEARRGELVDLNRELVRIPSLTGNEGAIQAFAAEEMRGLGLETDVWEPDAAELEPFAEHVGAFSTLAGRPNVVGRLRGSGG